MHNEPDRKAREGKQCEQVEMQVGKEDEVNENR